MNKKDTVLVLRGPTVYEGIRQVNGKMPYSGVSPQMGEVGVERAWRRKRDLTGCRRSGGTYSGRSEV